MTVSATSNFELSRDALITVALQTAQLVDAQGPAPAEYIALASVYLGMELDALQAEGVLLRTIERTTLALSATAEYTLAADTIDIALGNDNFAGTIVQSTGTETRVRAISSSEYVTQVLNKSSSGVPTLVYCEKQATTKLIFWPVPDATMTFSYRRIRLVKDSEPGSVTQDVARRWQKALCYAIAWQMALHGSKPQALWGSLKTIADKEKEKAMADDGEKTNIQMYVPRYY